MPLKVAIVIPAYNEEKTIGAVLDGVLSYGTVIVVDDGSCDQTADIAEQAGAIVVTHSPNQGYDGALRSGLLKALDVGVDVVVTIDADGQHNPANIQAVLTMMQRMNAECVVGVRPQTARISEALFSFYTSRRYGISDALCGLKAYRSTALRQHQDVLDIKSAGTAVALAIVASGKKVSEVEIDLHPRIDNARIGNVMRANAYIFGAMFRVMKRI